MDDKKSTTYTVKVVEYESTDGIPVPAHKGHEPKDKKGYLHKDNKLTVEELSENTATFSQAQKLMKIMDVYDGVSKKGSELKGHDGYIDAKELGKALAALEKKSKDDFKEVVGAGNNVDLLKLTSAMIKNNITHADIEAASGYKVNVGHKRSEGISLAGGAGG